MANLNDGLERAKGAMGGLIEPALIFAATGSKAAAAWGGLKTVLLTKVLGPISLLSGALVGVVGIMKTIISQTQLMSKGMNQLRQLETLKTQFQPLLGGAAAAKQRLSELYAFAASTPFQLNEIAEASKTLEVLSKGAISTGKSLRMIGDAAAISGNSMQTVAFWTGRLYAALKAGRPIGEAGARLMEMGVISGEVRNKLDASRAAGDSFIDTFALLTKEMERNKGGMDELSKTLGGLESTLADVQAQFAAGFAEPFKEGMEQSIKTQLKLMDLFAEPLKRIGFWLSRMQVWMSKLVGSFAGFGKSSKGAGQALGGLVDAFVALGAAIMAVQIATIITGMTAAGKAIGLATLKAAKHEFAMHKQALAHMGVTGAANLNAQALLALSGAHKKAIVTGGALSGIQKVLKFGWNMVASAAKSAWAAMVANPWVALIALLAAAGTAIYTLRKRKEALRKEIKDMNKAFDQMIGKLREAGDAVKTLDDKLALMASVDDKISSTVKKVEELSEALANKGMWAALGDIFMGTTGKEELESTLAGLRKLLDAKQEALSIDNNSLKLVKEKQRLMEQEAETHRMMAEMDRQSREENMTAAEEITILTERKLALEEKAARARANAEGMAVSAENKRVRAIKNEKELVEGKTGVTLGSNEENLMRAKLAKIEAEIQRKVNTFAVDAGELGEGDDAKIDTGGFMRIVKKHTADAALLGVPGVGVPAVIAKKVAEAGGMNFNPMQGDVDKLILKHAQLTRSLKINEEATKALKKAHERAGDEAEGVLAITKEVVSKIVETGGNNLSTSDLGIDKAKLGEGNVVGALQAKLKDETLDPKEFQAITKLIFNLKEEAGVQVEINKNYQKAISLLREKNRLAALSNELSKAERAFHDDMMAIDKKAAGGRIKELQAEEKLQAAIVKAHGDRGDGQDALESMQARLQKVNEKIGEKNAKADPDGTGKEAEDKAKLEEEARVLVEQINIQKKMNGEWDKKQQKLIAIQKKLKDMGIDAADIVRILKEDIQNELSDIKITLSVKRGDMDAAFDEIGKKRERVERQWEARERQKLNDQGIINVNQVNDMMAVKRKARDKEQGGDRAMAKLDVEREKARAKLQMDANLGDGRAKKELQALDNKELFEQKAAEFVKKGIDPKIAKDMAKDIVFAKMQREVKMIKPIADSFRQVGLGGFAAGADPLVKLNEKQAIFLAKIEANTAPKKGGQVDVDQFNNFLANLPIK
jgi:hypothetical protein